MTNIKKITGTVIAGFLLFVALSAFGQQDNRYDADKNLPFNEKAGDVNPQTGNVTISETDLELPGRAGFNFAFTRTWSLNQSNVFHMYQDPRDGTNRLSCDTPERVNRLGAGWSANLPYIMEDLKSGTRVLNLFINGDVFNINYDTATFKNGTAGNENFSNLIGYDLLDYRMYMDSGVTYGSYEGEIPAGCGITDLLETGSKYVLILKDNARYYFREDGKLMMQQDKSALNRIWYYYETPAEQTSRLRLVVDTVGRRILFDYDLNGCLSCISWDVTIGIKTGEERNRVLETRAVKYCYESAAQLPGVAQVYGLVNTQGAQPSYLLTKTVDPEGNTTLYAYREGTADFSYDIVKSHFRNVYLMLAEITCNYDECTGEFKNKRVFEYETPARGLYSKLFYNGFMKYYKISRQYYLDKTGKVMHDTRYVYCGEGEMGNYNQYSTVIETGNKKTTYAYSLGGNISLRHVLKFLQTETPDGFMERKEIAYDQHRTKLQEDVYRLGKWVYRETFEYDLKGNMKRHVDRAGLVTYREYNEMYSIPLKEIRTVTVGGIRKDYESRNIINPLGQVTQQKLFLEQSDGSTKEVTTASNTYDEWGNITSQTDAGGYTTYTVYDSVHHTFPVKTFRNVHIAAWMNGNDVHANWRTDPDGSPVYIRVRNWKVFNTDGTVWIEIDNDGYATEHYFDRNGREKESVNPGCNDEVSFAQPVPLDASGNPLAMDFDDFPAGYLGNPGESAFAGYFAARNCNAGARIVYDYTRDILRTETDIEHTGSSARVKVTEKEANGLENVIRETELGPSDERYEKIMEYDGLGRMIALTDPDSGDYTGDKIIHNTPVRCYEKTWFVFYDDLGRKKKVIYPQTVQGIVDSKELIYDDLRNTVVTLYPEARKTLERFDWNGNMVEVVHYGDGNNAAGNAITYTFGYDELKRKVSFTDAMGSVTTYRYDERSLCVEEGYGESGSDAMTYNDLGQLSEKTDRKGQAVRFTYDELGRNTYVTYLKRDASNQLIPDYTVSTVYDNRGNAIRVDNPNLIEHYEYDHAKRVSTLERFIRDENTRNRIAAGLSASAWCNDPAQQVFTFRYTYNDMNMVTSMTYPDGKVHVFEYDDALGRLVRIGENGGGFVDRLEYNRAGVVTKMDYANSTSQSWEFDNRDRIAQIRVAGTAGNTKVDLAYTLNGEGDVLEINDNEYTYDGFDRIRSARTLIPGRADLGKLVLEHFGTYENEPAINVYGIERIFDAKADLDRDGRVNGADLIRASMTDEKDTYDIEAFEYDKNGNRTKLVQNGVIYTYAYGKRDRLEKISVQQQADSAARLLAEYGYDLNGNTTARTVYSANGLIKESVSFEYDVVNRVTKTVKSDEQGQSVTEYLYDNAGNRLVKKGPGCTTVYLRHGQIAVAMDLELPAETSEEYTSYRGKATRYVLSGDLITGSVAETTKPGGSLETIKSYYHLEHLNSTKCVTDESGKVTAMYEYRAFGEQLKRLDEAGNETADKAKYSYGGKELDDAANLYYFNARYYDATTGRFISIDPVQDGENWYVYCDNNPLSFEDPTGLSRFDKLFPQLANIDRKELIGTYKSVGGHHIIAKANFKGHWKDPSFKKSLNYGICISQDFMGLMGWNHNAMTTKQRELSKAILNNNEKNLPKQIKNIAREALKAGGASREQANYLVKRAFDHQLKMRFARPSHIPYSKR